MTDISRREIAGPSVWAVSLLPAALIALCLLTWVGVVWLTHEDWRERESAASRLAGSEADEAAARIALLIHDADRTLLELRASGVPEAALDRWHKDGGAGGVAVIAPDGHASAQSPHANTAGWPAIMTRLATSGDVLAIGEPVLGKNGQPSVLPLARRFVRPDGSFGGIVMISLDGDTLSHVPSILAGLDECMTLIGDDGIVLARTPNPHGIVGMRFQGRTNQAGGTGRHISELDGVDRIFGYRHLDGLPARIVAGIGYEAVAAGWERFRAELAGAGVAVSSLILLIGGIWIRQRRAATLSGEILTQVLAGIDQGVRVERRDGSIAIANQAGLTLPRAGTVAQEDAVRIGRHDLSGGGTVLIGTDRTEIVAANARIDFLTGHDALTGLPNRWHGARWIQARLDGRSGFTGMAALILLDLDGFQAINATLGQAAGDEVLREIAQRLRDLAEDGDLVASSGGDEFLLFLSSPGDETAVMSLVKRIPRILARSITVHEQPVHLGVSMGIALYPLDGADAATLSRHASIALGRAKMAGRGTTFRFEPAMMAKFEEHRLLESDLRHALDSDELEICLQPQFSSATLDVTGFEALARWNHPTRGELSPSVFIPIAERSGLIKPLGLWAIEKACEAAAAWPIRHRVSVNVSPLQLRCETIQNDIRAILRRTQFPAHLLELEVTESVLLDEDQRTLETLHKLRAMDIRVALDDFGTGYASLSYLRRFPFDKIKIDQSFVRGQGTDRGTRVILEAMIRMCSDLGFDLVAEGVETEHQLNELRRLGCAEVQGFLLGKPMRPEMVADFLAGHGRRGGGMAQNQTIAFAAP